MTYSRQVAIYKLKVLILKYQTYKKLTYKILNAKIQNKNSKTHMFDLKCLTCDSISLAASSFSGLVINQHFFALGKCPNAGPLSDSSSHHFRTSFSEPLPVASSANQHCLAALKTCRRVISGWKLVHAHSERVSLCGALC